MMRLERLGFQYSCPKCYHMDDVENFLHGILNSIDEDFS